MTRAAVLALAFLTLGGAASEAAPKTPVTVKFVLKAYEGEFDTGQIDTLQKRAAERIVARLREHVPFLEFTTQEGSQFTLTATLRPRSADERSGAPGEVGFYFKLDGPKVQGPPEYIVFRPAHDLSGIPLVDGFVEEIDIKLSEDSYRGQLRPLHRQVPIARTGQVMSNPAGWVLPYDRSEICLDYESQLRIEHLVQLAPVVRHIPLTARADGDRQGQIFGSPINPSEFQQQLAAVPPSQVSVETIYVIDYRDLVPCSKDFPR